MFKRGLNHMLLALAILAAQWAGVAHSIEHRDQLGHSQFAHAEGKSDVSHIDLLHSCLIFDGLTTASTAVSQPPKPLSAPLLSELGIRQAHTTPPRNTLFSQRVRVRDPPLFS